jgi:hypothetical protein
MPSCRLIVCEKSGQWAAALRAVPLAKMPPLVETRAMVACRRALAESPVSLVAMEVSAANLGQVQDFVLEVGQRFPQGVMVALLTHEAVGAEALLREAGAVDAIASVIEIGRVAKLAARMAARTPLADATLSELIEQRVPWPALATHEWQSNPRTSDKQ